MLFKVYGVPWAGGAPDPLDVLKRFVKAEPKDLRLENPGSRHTSRSRSRPKS